MNTNQIARVAALIGEPARTGMLLALMDGRALTALELSRAGGVSAATGSRHLAQLVEAGLLQVQPQGRHRYHRLASAEVARLLESMMQLAAPAARPQPFTGPKDEALRLARRCYDHIAGRLGVAIADHLQAEQALVLDGDTALPGPALAAQLERLGLATAELPASRRLPCRPCMDWSARRAHLAGRLGALICSHCLEQGWLLRQPAGRALQLTPRGTASLRDWMGLAAWQRVASPAG